MERSRAGTILLALALATAAIAPAVPAAADELPNEDEPIAGAGVSFDTGPDGPNVTLGETTEFRNENPWVSDHNITLEPWGSVTSQADTHVRVNEFNGTWTNLTNIDATAGDITIKPNDKQSVTASGGVTTIRYDDGSRVAIGDGQTDFVIGADGSGSVTLHNLPASETFTAGTKSGTGFGQVTTDSTGTGTIPVSQTSGPEEVVLFENHSPEIDNASATPQGGEVIQQSQIDLSVNVSDAEFGTLQGESLDATFFLDGQQVGTDAVSANETTSTTVSNLEGGSHEWYVVVEDNYGQQTTSDTFSFGIPSTLRVFNESDPDQLVDNNVQLRLRFFTGEQTGQVFERTVSDGTVDLTGLPSNERFVVTVDDDAENFTYRRIIVDSLIEQQEVYLLPKKVDSVEVDFRLTDYTGTYPPTGTELYIESPISKDFDGDGSNETEYRVISGDNFGASGSFPATLQTRERYRLRVRNGPNQRVVGSYTATISQVEEIRIQGLTLEAPEGQTYATLTNITSVNKQRQLNFKYRDESNTTDQFSVTIVERASGNVTYTDTVTDAPINDYAVYSVPLENDTAYIVRWNATRDGQQINGSTLVGGQGIDIPLDPDWLGSAAMILIVFVMSLAGRRKHTFIAIGAVGVAGIMMWLEAIVILEPLWFLAAVVAVGGHLRQIQTPTEA